MQTFKMKLYSFLTNQGINLELDIFNYSFNIGLKYSIFLIITLTLSLLFHCFKETILFLITFISLRQYLGGFHFNNSKVCFLFSIIVTLLIPLLSNNIEYINIWFRTLIFAFCIFATNHLGPIDHKNKRLSETEKKIFKKKALTLLLLYYITTNLFYFIKLKLISHIIILTVIFITLNLGIGRLIKKIELTIRILA